MCYMDYGIWFAYFEKILMRGLFIFEHIFVMVLTCVIHAQAMAMVLLDPYNKCCPIVGPLAVDK